MTVNVDTITGLPSDTLQTLGAGHSVQGTWKPLGDRSYALLATAKTLAVAAGGTIPAGARAVLMQCSTQAVRFTTDGATAPTATVGQRLAVDATPYLYTGDLTKVQFIELAVSAVLMLSFFA